MGCHPEIIYLEIRVSRTEPLVVNEAQEAAVEKVAEFLVRFSLTLPAILTLETMRPLSFVGSQFMHVLSPAITTILSADSWDELAHLLEDRRGLDYLLGRIEELDKERRKS
jgi:hypothetical protein